MALNEQTKKRCNQLFKLGLMFNGDSYVKEDFNVHWTELTCNTDEQFEKKLSDIKEEMERRGKK